MTTYFFMTRLYSVSVIVVGFFCTLGIQETKLKLASRFAKEGKPATQKQIRFLAWFGVLFTTFMPVLNTGVFAMVIIKIVKAVKKHYE